MIDGAHVLTPGVLRFGMAGLRKLRAGGRRDAAVVRRSRPAARHGRGGLRPGERGRSCSTRSGGRPTATGSSRSATSSASATGSTGSWRATASSCPRALLEQVGGFDDSFSMPGGGYANLELFERLAASPDVTRRDDPRRRLVPPGARRDDDQRLGPRRPAAQDRLVRRALRGAAGPALPRPGQAAPLRRSRSARGRRRTRSRRMTAQAFAEAARRWAVDGLPDRPAPAARGAATRLHRGVLAQPRVAGHHLARPTDRRTRRPTSSRTRNWSPRSAPDWIIETGTGAGGRARVPRVDLRAARPRAGRVGRRPGRGAARAPADHLRRARRATTPAAFDEVDEHHRRQSATPSSILGLARRAPEDRPGVRRLRRSYPSGSLRRRREHHRQRPPGVARLRTGTDRGRAKDPAGPR